MLETCKIFEFDVFCGDLELLVEDSLNSTATMVVNTLNPHSYIESKKDAGFFEALKNSDVLIPDGSGIVLAAKILAGKSINRIAGFDLYLSVLNSLNKRSGKVFFLGSSEFVLDKIRTKITQQYSGVNVCVLSPPYKEEFDEADIEIFINAVNSFAPDVLFVGLTAPKQEKLIDRMQKRISPKICSGIGAVFDFYAETVTRPSKIWCDLHLEWLIRFLGEPARLWKRNFISTPLFLLEIAKRKFLYSN